MEANNFLEVCKSYSSLGYDLYLTTIFGRDGIRMTKRYSHKFEKPVSSQQIWTHEE
jgi:hypothetical protein